MKKQKLEYQFTESDKKKMRATIAAQICQLTLWSLLMMLSLYSLLPSIIPVTGLENHSLNSLCEANILGMRKCIRDHSSIRLFCKGVPVSSNRLQRMFQMKNISHVSNISMIFISFRKIFQLLWNKIWTMDFLLWCNLSYLYRKKYFNTIDKSDFSMFYWSHEI